MPPVVVSGRLWGTLCWLLVAVGGQAAALSLIDAGRSIRYQHYVPLAQLPSRPLAVGILVFQAVLVVWGLRSFPGSLLAIARRVLPGWRLPVLILATAASAATVGRDIPRFVSEAGLSTLIQLMSVVTIVLAVRALPDDGLRVLRTMFDRVLGADIPFGADVRPRLDRFAWVTAAIVSVGCALLSVIVYERHPHLLDEVVYLLQARTFASLRIALPSPPSPRSFELYLMTNGANGWYSPVPPGWAAALAAGVFVGAPWLVNPALAGANVLLGYLVLQPLYGRRAARVTTLLLAASPWSLFLGMSFMPHTFTLSCALSATLGVIATRRTGNVAWVWLAGAALGVMAAVRQLDAGVMALALGLWSIGVGGRKLRTAGTVGLVVGSLVLTVPLLAYNRHFTGKPGTFPIMTYNDATYGKGTNDYGFGKNRGMGWALDPNPGHGPVDGTINATLNISATQVELFGWSIGSLLLVYVLIIRGRLIAADRLMLGVIGITFTAYFFNYFAGGPDFGARYWFLMVVPLATLTARSALELGPLLDADAARGEVRALAAVSVLAASALLLFVPWRAVDKYWHYRGMRGDLPTVAQRQGVGRGLVLISGREVPDYASAFVYNPLDFRDAEIIYARRRDTATDSAVMSAFRDRPVWFVDGPSVSGSGYVVRAGPLPYAAAMRRVGRDSVDTVTDGSIPRP